MLQGVLIVEHPCSSFGGTWESAVLCPEWKVSRRATWDAFTPEQLTSCSESLLVANAVSDNDIFGNRSAITFFQWLRENPVSIPTFAILPDEDSELLQAAAGAVDDFLLFPFRPGELRNRVMRLLGSKSPSLEDIQSSLAGEIGLNQLVGQDPAFLKVLSQVALFGGSDAPVLLTGETGTGKELCARVMHLLSKRHHGPFIPVDCGALPDHLFENELFGHSRGAFTDARSDQKGLVALAQHGTLFMDEIDSLAPAAQGKVLRLLQEHTYRPLGSENFKQADLRIIAATNRDLEQLISQKQFRSDLFFRINVLRLTLPALRDRRRDVPLLAKHFVEELCRTAGSPKKFMSLSAMRKLEQHSWPGNVRELYNTIQRAVVSSAGLQISASAIDLNLPEQSTITAQDFRSAKLHAIQRFEKDYVKQMLEKHSGNVTRAAREAGKDRRAFGRLAKKYSIAGAA
ncbi:MAG TPA: sigma-54 dependent transcriptional regulator [Terriglobales bacterium]|nr:sigma-54 dependent transcriptional regulator [Terriglobales bacterium]